MEEIYVNLINKYIIFYKTEIKNNNIFDNIDYANYCSTNNQMELFNAEIEKFKREDDIFKNVIEYNENTKKKYSIKKNDMYYLSSDSLISMLIEMINIENMEINNEKFNYKLVIIK
jgi:hypothetical protein